MEAFVLAGSVIVIGLVVFNGALPGMTNAPLAFLCVPPLVWTAFRFDRRETATAIAVLSALAIRGTLRGFGPFAGADENVSLLLLQSFLGTMALSMLPLAAVVARRRQVESELAALAAIVESSSDAIVSKTLDGIITSWNPAAERLYGYTAAEAIGQPITLVIPPELSSELPKILEKIRTGARIDHYDTVRVARDGRRVAVSLMVSPIFDPKGRVVGASSIARDITMQRRLATVSHERDTLRAVASLAAAAAHEINNPLTIIRGCIELTAKDGGALNHSWRLSAALEAVDRIADIVRRMGRITRIEHVAASRHVPDMLDLRRS